MPSAYFKFVLEQLGTTRALRAAILEGTGLDPPNVASLGEEITVAQQLRQNRNVNAVALQGGASPSAPASILLPTGCWASAP